MDAEKPSAFMTDEDWGDEQRRKCAQVDATFAASGAGAVEAEAALDPLGPLLSMLLEEAKILQQHHIEARDTATKRLLWEARYGKPFDQGNANRLLFWGTQKKTMPLLFFVAGTLLTAPGASTDNERAHSLGGRIVSKERCSLVGDSVDRNTTGYLWLRRRAAAKAEELKGKGIQQEDLEDDPGDLGALEVREEDEEEIISVNDEVGEEEEEEEGGGGGGGGGGH